MWLPLLACGLVIFGFFRHLFSDDDVPVESSVSRALFHVANRIEKLHGGKVYVGLRIPDADSGSRETIDLVVVNKGVAMVIAVRTFLGFVDIDSSGSWVCKDKHSGRLVRHPNPVEETKRQVAILESYLEQRGLTLPEGRLTSRVVLTSPTCRLADSLSCNPDIITSDKLAELMPGARSGFSNWIKDTFGGAKSEMQETINHQFHFILRTAPMWDRLKLKGDKSYLGEFSDFKGAQADIQALGNVRRAKVSQLNIQTSSMFGGLGTSYVHVLYAPRDYRGEGPSSSEWKEVTVKSRTEVLFQPIDSKKPRKIKLSHVVSMTLGT